MIWIYTRIGCPHCTEIKQYLSNRKIDFTEIKIGEDVDREEVLELFPDQKTLPIITLCGDVVGSSELRTIIENDQLQFFNIEGRL